MRFFAAFLISVCTIFLAFPQKVGAGPEVIDKSKVKEEALEGLESDHQGAVQTAIDRQVAADIKLLEDILGKKCPDDRKTTPPNSIQLAKQLISVKSVLLDADELALPRGGKLCDDNCVCWVGKATYYGPRFWNRRTKTGEILKKGACTVAVHGFELPVKLTIRNLANEKVIQVKANDRMSKKSEAIVDIEEGCANKIGIGNPKTPGLAGHAKVEMKYCPQ